MNFTRIVHTLHPPCHGDRLQQQNTRHILTFHDPGLYAALRQQWLTSARAGAASRVFWAPLAQCIIAPSPLAEQIEKKWRHEAVTEEDSTIHLSGLSSRTGGGPGIPWGVKAIKAPQAWSISTGYGIKVGVIDTGIDVGHPDLQHSLGRGINLVHRGLPPFDDNGHGTHISGTIAAANSTRGMIGVAPRSIIYPVKAFDANGSAYVSDIIAGIDWCVRSGADLINMSFGMQTRSRSLLDIVNRAGQAGIVVVASSGNDGKRRAIDYPARYPQTISVGATDRKRKIASFSNRGQYVDIYAPGDKIMSAWLHGKYHEMSGTSMATSHVSGTIALLLAQRPGLKPAAIKALLQRTAVPLRLQRGISSSEGEINTLKFIREGLRG
ncbi:peptidase S8/S53 subtilisin kexin sedolisin [Paenibacillus algicola]|uniref:Peptidase S8/S53 subtilisin kexin sedolisin n=1 Tax=Paenibacillus algicola TaxID=2565926 RepID=A0A4P8XER9_9BACL|nr:S8 family serine peptidase [Paenibacillus algicola]QCT00847.1 peptidase S8/S53 subtilisin kexin sedolisin [Paenibacillus algicola]